MEGADLAVKLLSTWLTLVGGLILLPSAFGLSLGISEIYMKILVKTLEVSAGKDVEPRLLRGLRELGVAGVELRNVKAIWARG